MTDYRTTIPLWQSVKTMLHKEKPDGLSWNSFVRAVTTAWIETADSRKLDILKQAGSDKEEP